MKKAILFLLRQLVVLRPQTEVEVHELIKEINAEDKQPKQPAGKSR